MKSEQRYRHFKENLSISIIKAFQYFCHHWNFCFSHVFYRSRLSRGPGRRWGVRSGWELFYPYLSIFIFHSFPYGKHILPIDFNWTSLFLVHLYRFVLLSASTVYCWCCCCCCFILYPKKKKWEKCIQDDVGWHVSTLCGNHYRHSSVR